MGCGTSMVKYLLFFFNFLFVIGGIVLITAGALSYVKYDKYLEIAKEVDLNAYMAPPILMMVLGSIIFVIAFLGCCGAMQENNCMMMTYGFVLALLLIAQIGIVVVANVYKDDFEKVFREGFTNSLQKYGKDDEPLMEAWNSMQQTLTCCGIEDYKDWSKSTWNPNMRDIVPESCCKTVAPGCSTDAITQGPEVAGERIYTEGCLKKAISEIGIFWITVGGSVVAAVEFLGIIFSCCLAGRFRRKHYAV